MMKRDGQISDRELDACFEEARHEGIPEIPAGLWQAMQDDADRLQPAVAASPGRHRRLAGWWRNLWSLPAYWQPAAVMAAFALLGFALGSLFADSAELLAGELLTVQTAESGNDIFSDLEQLIVEG